MMIAEFAIVNMPTASLHGALLAMTFSPIEIQISPEQILSAIQKMPEMELDVLIRQVLQIRGQRQAPNLSKTESDLLHRVTYCIPVELQTRFNELVKKRQATTINEIELQELCDLNDRIELLEASRIQDLAQLAQLRSVSLSELMKQLKLKPVNHG